ncbi:MAG: hypothetical protein ACI9SJ_000976 [Flavobacteriaceae bacterium]|jgi:hypothetical protein|uniref:DUF922 domain-containing protein n=1 Tax=Candidatus Marifrigoribacter sp. Uisw_064 TaxID=3230970 RepID=UPI003AED96BF
MFSILRFLFIFFFLFPSEVDPVKMTWSDSQKLTWEDFQGKPKLNSGYVATTNSGMSFSYSYSKSGNDIDYDYKVHSYFYPETSWYIPSKVDQHILNHEQTHFDISELHARILRKKIGNTVFSENIKSEIEKLYSETEQERVAMQHQFDKESDHSKNRERELQWEAFVQKEIIIHEPWN